MSDRLRRLTSALAPTMNRIQAEGFLHLAAISCDKRPECLTFDDWPAIERVVRDALRGTASSARADDICDRLRDAFIIEAEGPSC